MVCNVNYTLIYTHIQIFDVTTIIIKDGIETFWYRLTQIRLENGR